ncbi:hypothetical protein [Sulfurimonas sp.]|uniref:hypothetical protein n=1 Tax=Sulfurimonas sp. TaxID=2022749 RepID=UPI00356565A1
MFVSTYSTYLNANSVNKSAKERELNSSSSSSKLFENALKTSTLSSNKPLVNIPVNYISHNKIMSTKERLNEQLKQNSIEANIQKFTNINSKIHAPSSYADNTKMFSLMLKEQQTLKGKDPINKDLPKEIQELKESNLRTTMVNTYLENDKYYRITA